MDINSCTDADVTVTFLFEGQGSGETCGRLRVPEAGADDNTLEETEAAVVVTRIVVEELAFEVLGEDKAANGAMGRVEVTTAGVFPF